MTNITINLKNCGCGCGGSSGGSTLPEYQPPIYNTPGDTIGISGPPEGYGPPSALSDRQCKMAVWIYDWIDTCLIYFGTTTQGKYMLTAIVSIVGTPGASFFVPAASSMVSFVLGVVAIPDPSDLVVTIITYAVAHAMFTAIAKIGVELNQPFVADTIPYFQSSKGDFICSLSQSTGAVDARQRIQRVTNQSGMSQDQQDFISAMTITPLLNLLFYTADWWPSFDDDVLTPISATCCGDYVSGDPVTPGSLQQCQASYYVVDMLAIAFNEASTAFGFWLGNLNPFDERTVIKNWLIANLNIPDKVMERAADYNAFLTNITEIVYNATWLLDGGIAVDPGLADLAAYITANRTALVSLIQSEPGADSAYTALKADLDAWINANIASRYSADTIKALDALIKPVNAPYLLDLLFTQDSDLLLYAAADCADVGPLIFNQDDSSDLNVPLLVDTWNGTEREFQADGLSDPTIVTFDFTQFINAAPGTQDITVDFDFWITHKSDGFHTHNHWRYIIQAVYQDTSEVGYTAYSAVDQDGADRWISTQAIVTDSNPANPVVGLKMRLDTGTSAPGGVNSPTSATWIFKAISAA